MNFCRIQHQPFISGPQDLSYQQDQPQFGRTFFQQGFEPLQMVQPPQGFQSQPMQFHQEQPRMMVREMEPNPPRHVLQQGFKPKTQTQSVPQDRVYQHPNYPQAESFQPMVQSQNQALNPQMRPANNAKPFEALQKQPQQTMPTPKKMIPRVEENKDQKVRIFYISSIYLKLILSSFFIASR